MVKHNINKPFNRYTQRYTMDTKGLIILEKS